MIFPPIGRLIYGMSKLCENKFLHVRNISKLWVDKQVTVNMK